MLELLGNGKRRGAVPGQQIIETIGTTDWVVPAGVTELNGCAIATGFGTGAGGGLSWRNNIPVTPGETLQIVNLANTSSNSLLGVGVKRGADWLLVAYCGDWSNLTGGKGGKNADAINDGGGNGGNGILITLGSQPGYCGGGAGGYTGNGGNGGAFEGQGGGGGGGGYYYESPNRYRGTGGGTGIIKAGANGSAGSRNSRTVAGTPGSDGSSTTYGGGVGGKSGVRLIWGKGRSYPTASQDVVAA